jgi:hypothetical protein
MLSVNAGFINLDENFSGRISLLFPAISGREKRNEEN